MKLPLGEAPHAALRRELARWDGYVSSALLGVEAVRACARYGEAYAERARHALAGLSLIPIDDAVLALARELDPPTLRTLDTIHLATALAVADEIGVVVAYDDRLRVAAADNGLAVAAPA